jgi:hypothetical protein
MFALFNSLKTEPVLAKVILRPTASRPVILGVKLYLGLKTIRLLLPDGCDFVDMGCSL